MSTTEVRHLAWCDPQHCFVTEEGVRVHQQALVRWEDNTAEQLRFETRLIGPGERRTRLRGFAPPRSRGGLLLGLPIHRPESEVAGRHVR
jgi:hypothetical protein